MSVQTTTASTGDELTVFFGAAGGSAQKALRMLGESNVMLSYQTKNNRPWDGIETLFIDSGGYSLMLAEGTHERFGVFGPRDSKTYICTALLFSNHRDGVAVPRWL